MSVFEIPQINPDVPVEKQLFLAVESVCQMDGEFVMQQNKKIKEWNAPYGNIALSGVELTKPPGMRGFAVKQATLEVDKGIEGVGISIGARNLTKYEDLEYPEIDYDRDFIARDVLEGFLRYIAKHPHDACIALRRRQRIQDKGLQITAA